MVINDIIGKESSPHLFPTMSLHHQNPHGRELQEHVGFESMKLLENYIFFIGGRGFQYSICVVYSTKRNEAPATTLSLQNGRFKLEGDACRNDLMIYITIRWAIPILVV